MTRDCGLQLVLVIDYLLQTLVNLNTTSIWSQPKQIPEISKLLSVLWFLPSQKKTPKTLKRFFKKTVNIEAI